MKQIAQGAEARLYSDGNIVVKHRFKKNYRHPKIDEALIKYRTRREAKIIERMHSLNFPAPGLISVDEGNGKISMSFLNGALVKEILHKDHQKISKEIGRKVAILHKNNIIHGDLTTSNMIFDDDVFFIDFGLSFFSERIEDKAVDLHLLRQAFESKHYQICEECFEEALEGYKENYPESQKVIERLKVVERRGRNKKK